MEGGKGSMVQVKSYQGYFKNGQFMSPQAVNLPENVEVFITITGRDVSQETMWGAQYEDTVKYHTPERQAAIKFIEATTRINEEDFDAETLEIFSRWDDEEFRLDFEERLP